MASQGAVAGAWLVRMSSGKTETATCCAVCSLTHDIATVINGSVQDFLLRQYRGQVLDGGRVGERSP